MARLTPDTRGMLSGAQVFLPTNRKPYFGTERWTANDAQAPVDENFRFGHDAVDSLRGAPALNARSEYASAPTTLCASMKKCIAPGAYAKTHARSTSDPTESPQPEKPHT
jgi:hypothetical protein